MKATMAGLCLCLMLSMLTLTVLASDIGARSLHNKEIIPPPVVELPPTVHKQSREFARTIQRKGMSQRNEDEDKMMIALRGKDEGEGKIIF